MLAAASMIYAQAWVDSYSRAMTALERGDFATARQAFQEANAVREGDIATPSALPGPVTERRVWRNGAPYSPNFGAAYALYRQAEAESDQTLQTTLRREAASEFRTLFDARQQSAATVYFLLRLYSLLEMSEDEAEINRVIAADPSGLRWQVDTAFLLPEERAQIDASAVGRQSAAATGRTQEAEAPVLVAGRDDLSATQAAAPLTMRVSTLPFKYALVIGNSESSMESGAVPFSAGDAEAVRDALIQHAGYEEGKVRMLLNASASEIREAVSALAAEIEPEATIFIYFSGQGFNLDGQDFVAGVDAEFPTDASRMVSKRDLFQPFLARGAFIFSFFQADRSFIGGAAFGQEVLQVGRISEHYATIEGQGIFSFVVNERETGLFTNAMVVTFREFRSNRIPITEFGWSVFRNIRTGGSEGRGGSSQQTPTLPILTNLANDARF